MYLIETNIITRCPRKKIAPLPQDRFASTRKPPKASKNIPLDPPYFLN